MALNFYLPNTGDCDMKMCKKEPIGQNSCFELPTSSKTIILGKERLKHSLAIIKEPGDDY